MIFNIVLFFSPNSFLNMQETALTPLVIDTSTSPTVTLNITQFDVTPCTKIVFYDCIKLFDKFACFTFGFIFLSLLIVNFLHLLFWSESLQLLFLLISPNC